MSPMAMPHIMFFPVVVDSYPGITELVIVQASDPEVAKKKAVTKFLATKGQWADRVFVTHGIPPAFEFDANGCSPILAYGN